MNHNKIVATAAKKALAPLGLKQQGSSRIWYDDRGWWAIVMEFQPSSWDRGSYLNVALSWMFYEHDHWTFDIGGRSDGFRSATATLDHMYAHYQATTERHGDWPDYYAGVLAGLRGDRTSAEQHPAFFRDSIFGIVLRARAGRGLDEMPPEEIGLP
ncbi:MAG TPA: hypothetical protein VH280_15700 [Verrucomicrobiae bacterium]|jgi:hypothetical protein|nr:hypothetical protein [Verrucomicrobiae bacterium]